MGDYMALHDTGFDLRKWFREDDTVYSVAEHKDSEIVNMGAFLKHVQADYLPQWLVVDLTNSESLVRMYPAWLHSRTHVITRNVYAASCGLHLYREIIHAKCEKKTLLGMGACIGAGLPMLHTVKDMVLVGDTIQKIEAELSAATSFVLNSLQSSVSTGQEKCSFSSLCRNAILDQGLTEDELMNDKLEIFSGEYCARKAVMLARELGVDIELQDVVLDGLIPQASFFGAKRSTVEGTLDILKQYDDAVMKRVAEAVAESKQLKLITTITTGRNGKASVQLQKVSQSHPFASINGPVNGIAVYSKRYKDSPMVLQGPGAGACRLASAIFNDILRLGNRIGARDHGGEKSFTNGRFKPSPSPSLNDLSALSPTAESELGSFSLDA